MTTQENQSKGEEKCALCGAPAGKRHSDGYACFTPPHSEVEGDWRDGFDKIWFNKKYIDSNGRTIKTDLYFALLAYFSHLLAEREGQVLERLKKLFREYKDKYPNAEWVDAIGLLAGYKASQLTPKDNE